MVGGVGEGRVRAGGAGAGADGKHTEWMGREASFGRGGGKGEWEGGREEEGLGVSPPPRDMYPLGIQTRVRS